MKILDISSDTFIEDFKAAIGLKEGEKLQISGPQFERTDGIKPISNPVEVLYLLKTMPEQTLKAVGLCPWGEYGLWLLPYQWYDHIPEGFELLCITGRPEIFARGVTDDDMRFGCLAYGIVPDFEKSNTNA